MSTHSAAAPASTPVTGRAGPAVSVVLPTCARPALPGRCLAALARHQLAPHAYEIVVVDDDGGAHASAALVAAWRAHTAARGGPDIVWLANHGPRGPAAARNLGWRNARAPLIAFTDDDTVPCAGWLRHGLAAFGPGVDAAAGRIIMPLPACPSDYARNARALETVEFATANCFCRKQVLAELGGFDERFRLAWRADSDLHFRLLGRHTQVVRAPRALVPHPLRPAPWGVSALQPKKMFFDALLYKKHPLLYRQKIRAAPRWDYYAIVAALLAAALAWAAGLGPAAAAFALLWLLMTARFCLPRLRGTPRTCSHVAEMLLTSVLIPPHAVFRRLAGAVHFRVLFA